MDIVTNCLLVACALAILMYAINDENENED